MIIEKKAFHFSYIYEKDDSFFKLGYQIINKKKTVNTLKCLKVMHNNCIKIMYSTENLIPIDNLLRSGFFNNGIYLIKEIINLISRNVEEGFFVKEAFDISYDKIFYDKEKKQFYLVLLPINSEINLHDNDNWQGRFRKTLLNILMYCNKQPEHSVLYHMCFFEKASFERIKVTLCNDNTRPNNYRRVTGNLSSGNLGMRNYYLISENNERCDMYKEDMIFGSSKKLADVVISNSKLISRIHFRIRYKNNKWYVSDLDSTNHTYYDGQMLASGQEVALCDGGIIRAANTTFLVRCE